MGKIHTHAHSPFIGEHLRSAGNGGQCRDKARYFRKGHTAANTRRRGGKRIIHAELTHPVKVDAGNSRRTEHHIGDLSVFVFYIICHIIGKTVSCRIIFNVISLIKGNELFGIGIIGVHKHGIGKLRKPSFCRKIGTCGSMIIEMLRAEIGKNTELKAKCIRAVLCQRLRGNLHHAILTTRLHHIGKRSVKRRARGRCVTRLPPHAAVNTAERADEPAFAPRVFQQKADIFRRGGFAVGARYADELQSAARLPEERAAKPCERFPAVCRYIIADKIELFLTDHRRRAPAQSLGGK